MNINLEMKTMIISEENNLIPERKLEQGDDINLNSLKKEIHSISLDNISSAKSLFKQLIPDESKDKNINILNSEQAVQCLRVVRENADTLVKLYSELNRGDDKLKEAKKEFEIYSLLDKLAGNPFDNRKLN